jgi:hypothetical protein
MWKKLRRDEPLSISSQRRYIKEAFAEADIDGSGTLDRPQLFMLMIKMKQDILHDDEPPREAAVDWWGRTQSVPVLATSSTR